MPFRTQPGQPRDLLALVRAEVRERIEEAVDHVVLEVMVEVRRARGLAQPQADNDNDRAEFHAFVREFLEHLDAALRPAMTGVEPRVPMPDHAAETTDPAARLLDAQVVMAQTLPDYWQRFDAERVAFAARRLEVAGGQADVSSRERPGWLSRLFGR